MSSNAPEERVPFRRTAVRFSIFFAVFLAIVGVIVVSKTLLIAPPYAVSAYLMVFNRGRKYAQPPSIIASYLVVIASSVAFEYVLGVTLVALVLNVAVVSLFISFSPFTHPPALALTIFSYIVRDSPAFVLTSVVVLLIVVAADLAILHVPPIRQWLEDGPS
jgi:CBS-domain-containing membrane protein